MEYHCLLLRYGELFLKGRSHALQFERQLQQNLFQMTGKRPQRVRGRLVMEHFPEHQKLRRVFGLTSYSPAFQVDKNLEKIKGQAFEIAKSFSGTFKVETRRADKSFPLTSQQVNAAVGQYLETHTALTADFYHPQHTLYLEINQDAAYLFTETISCPGGLPVGVSGKVLLLVEDEASILAGLLMLKRGCRIIPVSLREKPDISLLQQYSPTLLRCHAVPDLVDLNKMTAKEPYPILVSGQNLEKRQDYPTARLVFRPLIAYSREEIRQQLRQFNSPPTLNMLPGLPAPNLLLSRPFHPQTAAGSGTAALPHHQ